MKKITFDIIESTSTQEREKRTESSFPGEGGSSSVGRWAGKISADTEGSAVWTPLNTVPCRF